MEKHQRPASGREILNVLGSAAAETVAAFLRTEASPQEVRQAFECLHGDDYMGGTLCMTMNAKVRDVYDILLSDRDKFERADIKDVHTLT